MKTIHYPNTLRSHLVTNVPIAPFTPKPTSKLTILRKNKLARYSGHLDEKNDVFEQYFPMSYPSDMDDLAMTCSYFVNALKMLISSEKHPVSRADYGYTKKVVIDRWATK